MNRSAIVIPFAAPRRRRDSAFQRVIHGIYVPATDALTLERRAAAVAAELGRGHVAADRTAAWLHGIDAHAWSEHETPPPLEFCAPPGTARAERDGVRGRHRTLHPSEIMELGGVRLTTPLRTALDLGCELKRREAMAALDAFCRHHGLTAHDLRAGAVRFRGRRGVVQLRELTELVDPRAESPRESWTRLALIDAGLPAPEPQVWVTIDGEPVYRLDLAYRLARIAIEYDGEAAHSSVEDRVRDERRRRELRALGWTIIVIKLGDFAPDRIEAWTSKVKEALGERYTSRRW